MSCCDKKISCIIFKAETIKTLKYTIKNNTINVTNFWDGCTTVLVTPSTRLAYHQVTSHGCSSSENWSPNRTCPSRILWIEHKGIEPVK